MYQYPKSHSIYFQYHKKLSIDPSEYPFDIAAYNRICEIEETYMINRFRERRNKILKDRKKHISYFLEKKIIQACLFIKKK